MIGLKFILIFEGSNFTASSLALDYLILASYEVSVAKFYARVLFLSYPLFVNNFNSKGLLF